MTQPELTMEEVEQIQDCAAEMLNSGTHSYKIRPSTLYNICTAALAHLRSQPSRSVATDEVEAFRSQAKSAMSNLWAQNERAELHATIDAICDAALNSYTKADVEALCEIAVAASHHRQPAGYVSVPMEPTMEMLDAALFREPRHEHNYKNDHEMYASIYKAMLSAPPRQQAKGAT